VANFRRATVDVFRKVRLAVMLAVVALLLPAGLPAQAGGAGPADTPHLTVELVTQTTAIAPNHDFLAGLHFVIEPRWHIYWINAGDAGEPPRVDWRLPAGITAQGLQFPAPVRLPLGPLMDFGYEGQILLPVSMHAGPQLKPGRTVTLRGDVHYLVCSSVCLPGHATVARTVAVASRPGPPDPKTQPLFAAAQRALPRTLPDGASVQLQQTRQHLVVTVLGIGRQTSAELYPFDANVMANAAPQHVQPLASGLRVTVRKAPVQAQMPATFHGLLKLPDRTAYQFQQPIPPVSAGPIAPVNLSHPAQSLAGILILAFLGGVILNLMPCVFPVLFIKGLSLVQSSGEERGRMRAHGVMYTAGILVSFWLIVGLLLILRAGGAHVGWGFQFQSPYFVAVMALLFFFLGLSLAGQFELGLSATSLGGSLANRAGYSGSFFTGVLATVVATPCTAPFMGAAIGFALSQSAAVTFAVFTAIALGLATPYVLLTLQPAWVRLLPKPGAWMELLKQAVSLPIFLAVIWMAWVFFQITGSTGVAGLMIGLLFTAIAGWALGRWPARRGATFAAILLLAVAIVFPVWAARQPRPQPAAASSASGMWQPFSPVKLAQYRAQGKPVFVDFSAAWCLSCQVNERTVLDSTSMEQVFRAKGVVTMRADWTNHNDTITAALAQLGRSGVPTYALYPADAASAPVLLPEVLTRSIVADALAKLPPQH
jgi:thiol:disulfide interchange protein